MGVGADPPVVVRVASVKTDPLSQPVLIGLESHSDNQDIQQLNGHSPGPVDLRRALPQMHGAWLCPVP